VQLGGGAGDEPLAAVRELPEPPVGVGELGEGRGEEGPQARGALLLRERLELLQPGEQAVERIRAGRAGRGA